MMMFRSRLKRGMDIHLSEFYSGGSEQHAENFSGIKLYSLENETGNEVRIYLCLLHQNSDRLCRLGTDGCFRQGVQQRWFKGTFEQLWKPLCAASFATGIMKSCHPLSVSGKKFRPIILRQQTDTFMMSAFSGSS